MSVFFCVGLFRRYLRGLTIQIRLVGIVEYRMAF